MLYGFFITDETMSAAEEQIQTNKQFKPMKHP